MPTRERYVWICTNRRPDGHPKGSCAERGSEELQKELKKATAGAGLAGRVRVMTSSCMDLCEHGVAVMVMPDGVILGGVTNDDVAAIVEGVAEAGGTAGHPRLAAKRLVSDGEGP